MKTKEICFCGNYDIKHEQTNGQSIKTNYVTKAIKKVYSSSHFHTINTRNWKKSPFSLLVNIIIASWKYDYIFIFPDQNGVKIILPIMAVIARIKGNNLYYIVIGGWLAELIKSRKWLSYFLSKVKMIFVETNTLKLRLTNLGVTNVSVLKNFKSDSIKRNFTNYEFVSSKPMNICFYARVTEGKGILNLIRIINRINSEFEKFQLDIYGPIDESINSNFLDLLSNSNSIKYVGCVDDSEGALILSNYSFMVFPTCFYTEGIPGSIIDSYLAGTPVISSNWESAKEVVIDGITGYLYEFGNSELLYEILLKVYDNPNLVDSLRANCMIAGNDYLESKVINDLLVELNS